MYPQGQDRGATGPGSQSDKERAPIDATKELRTLAAALKQVDDVGRLKILEEVARLAQRLSDQELLVLTQDQTQEALAQRLGITQQAVSKRIASARRRLGRTQQNAR